jgi:hypothetical protein
LEVVTQERKDEARKQIADELAKEKIMGEEGWLRAAQSKRAGEERVAEEKQRRTEQAQRIVRRLLHSQLAHAFDSYAYRVSEVKRQRETCSRVVLRMQKRALAGAFDMFIGTVWQLKANLQIVQNVVCRLRKKAMATAMWAWMEYAKEKWRALLEHHGLLHAADILENYGICSETDVWELDENDFSKLESLGQPPLDGKKLSRWCQAGEEEKMKKKDAVALQMHWQGRAIYVC